MIDSYKLQVQLQKDVKRQTTLGSKYSLLLLKFMKTRKREKGIWVLKQSIIKNTMEPQQHLKCHIAKHTNYIYNIMTTSKSNGLMDGGVIWYNQAHVTYNYV